MKFTWVDVYYAAALGATVGLGKWEWVPIGLAFWLLKRILTNATRRNSR